MSVSLPPTLYYTTIAFKFKYLLFILTFANSYAQNVTIKGRAHTSYKGKVIQLFSQSDYITGTELKENQDTIDADGYFELHLQSEYTQPVTLRIETAVGKLYVQPALDYTVTFPELEPAMNYNNGADLPVNIGIIGSDSTELNALIFDYQGLYTDLFAPEEHRFFSRAAMFKLADSLDKICTKRYKGINNDYFQNYVKYSIASINASVSRGENFLINGYLLNKPIQYHHCEYMQFFNACFSGYLTVATSASKGQSLYNVVNVKASYKALTDLVKNDKFLKSDSLRELVIIKNLWDFYFAPDFVPTAVENVLTQLNQQTQIAEHRRITSTMLVYINKLQPGSKAPDFAARTREGTIGTLNAYKKHWVYLNFFSTQNTESLKEMSKIAALKKKFGDKISFISICLDDTLKTYINYVKANPKFDWAIWYNYEHSAPKTAREAYFVSGTEAYFLINNNGYLVQSPALSPAKGIEYKFNILFKTARRTTKTGIR